MKKAILALTLAAGIAVGGAVLAMNPANADEQAKATVTIKLNGGFRITDTTVAAPVYSDEDVTYTANAGEFVFTHENVRTMFGNSPVYKKAEKIDGEYKIEYPFNVGQEECTFIFDEEGRFNPREKRGTLTPILFGVYEDTNSNGVLDTDEKLYQSGDAIQLTDGMVLTCYYNDDFYYKVNTRYVDEIKYVALQKAWKNPDNSDRREKYTARDLQPFWQELYEIGSQAFSTGGWTDTIKSVELPDTVHSLSNHAFNMTFKMESLKGIENVREITDWAMPNFGKDYNGMIRLNWYLNTVCRCAFALAGENAPMDLRLVFIGTDNQDKYKILSAYGYGNEPKYLLHDDNGVGGALDFEDPSAYVYVPYGETEEWYPLDADYEKTSFSPSYVMGQGTITSLNRVNIPVREMYEVTFDLNGGNIAGETQISSTYMDARAVSVKRTFGGVADQEANLTSFTQDNVQIRSTNPAEQTPSYLPAEKPEDPVLDGYAFAGWQDQNGYIWTNEEWAAGGHIGVYENGKIQLTAVYKKGVSVTYKYNSPQADLVVGTYEDAKLEKPADPENKAFYNFTGWYSDAACTQAWDFDTMTIGSEDMTLYAGWESQTIKATLNTNGGILTETQSVVKQQDGKYQISYKYDEGVQLPVPETREGYVFGGWYKDANFTGNAVTQIEAQELGVSYYAKWTANTYQITYDLDGGENSAENPAQYEYGTVVTLKAATKEGYVFEGWYTTATFEENSKVTEIKDKAEDIALYAKFRQIAQFTVTIEHSIEGKADTVLTVTEGEKADTSSLAEEGYRLVGIYTDANYTQEFDADTQINANTTLYAKWEAEDDGKQDPGGNEEDENKDDENKEDENKDDGSTDDEKGTGCGGSIVGVSAASTVLLAGAAVVAVLRKRKED